MGRAGKEDHLLRQAPIETVIREASEPHLNRGKIVTFKTQASAGGNQRQPEIFRRPEIIHGIRNFVQNAVDFSQGSVLVAISWTDDLITVDIGDDGPGFPSSVLNRIGEPFVRRRKSDEGNAQRPGYEGMGLGLFIAKTLLERSGATLSFVNGPSKAKPIMGSGAIVTVHWPRSSIEPSSEQARGALGDNTLIR